MIPIEASNDTQPPPGFYRGPAPRSGTLLPLAEQDSTLIHHLASVSRAKLDNLFRSRKDSGLLKHVLIHNLSRSYEELVSEVVVTEERDNDCDEVMVSRNAEEMWFNAVLQDLNDGDDDEPMFVSDSQFEAAQYFYATAPSEEDLDLAMSSPPALSPDMFPMDESELDLTSDANSRRNYGFDSDDEDDGMTSPPLMDLDERDRSAYFELTKREQASILHRHLMPISTGDELAAFQKMRFFQARQRRERGEWADAGDWVYYD